MVTFFGNITPISIAPAPPAPWVSELPPVSASFVDNGASGAVSSGFASAQAYASAAFTEATTFLAQLQASASAITNLPLVDATFPTISASVDAFVSPATPARPGDLAMSMPAAPGDPAIANVAPLTVPGAPQFTATLPDINLNIAVPAPLTDTAPAEPSLSAVLVPTVADVVLPDVPTLQGITIPAAPLINLPVFQAVLPDSPLAPAFFFSFSESAYTSALLTSLRTTLQEWVLGTSTGLPPAVEDALWQRARAREMLSSRRKVDDVVRTYARSGFTRPPGAMQAEIGMALQDSQGTVLASSREVAINQANLEQTNRHFAFEQAWKVEEGLITYTNQMAQRSFEAAKFAQQVAIDIYRVEAEVFTAQVQAFAAKVEAFKAQLQAELAKLDIFKSEIEAQKLIGEINMQLVEVYKARVQAVQAVIDIARARIEAANAQASVNKTIIEGYAASVNAYGEKVRAKASEYDAYATQVKAQVAKVEVYTAQADAFGKQVDAFKATVEALVAAKDSEIKVGVEVPLDVFGKRVDIFGKLVQAEGTRLDAVTKVYSTDAQVYTAEVQAEGTRINSQVEVLKADTQLAVAQGNLRIEAAKANIQTLVQQVTLLVEAMKAGAQVAAQLASAALASVNLSAQIGDHTSHSEALSNSYSNSNVNSASNSASNSTTNSATSTLSEQYSTISQDSTSDVTQHIYNYTP